MNKRIQTVVFATEAETLLNILSAASLSFAFEPEMRNQAAALLGRLNEISQPSEITDEEYDKYVQFADTMMTDGEIEMDMPTPAISVSDDGGTYINTWFWLDGVAAGVLEDEDT